MVRPGTLKYSQSGNTDERDIESRHKNVGTRTWGQEHGGKNMGNKWVSFDSEESNNDSRVKPSLCGSQKLIWTCR